MFHGLRAKSLIIPAIIVTSLLVVLLLPSCSQSSGEAHRKSNCGCNTATPAAQETPDPPARSDVAASDETHGLHVLDNDRLRTIMRRLSQMNFDEMEIEIEKTGALNRDIRDIASYATDLASDAAVVPIIFRNTEMNDEARRVLDEMSRRLHADAIALHDAAVEGSISLVKERLDQMIKTCNNCHATFRAPAVATAGRPRISARISELEVP
ncbi:MAG: cytochrome c [Phycisphaerae bacterium]|nr:cytochrome c [Phycisphaerae bacterium]